jgi:hypothetical protein
VQFVSEPLSDIPIPDQAGIPEAQTTFGTLKESQAQGDALALLNARRRIIRFRLGSDLEGELGHLLESMKLLSTSDLLQPA